MLGVELNMAYIDLSARRRIFSVLGLAALCSAGACHTTSTSGKDASATGGGSDAAPTVAGSDASSSTAGADATPTSPAGTFAAAFASTFCDSLAGCCRQAGFDPSPCLATVQPQVTAIFTLRATDPKIQFDEAAGASCINAYRTALTTCTDSKLWYQVDDFCIPVFRGTVPAGGSCTEDYQCAVEGTRRPDCSAGVCIPGYPDAANAPHGVMGDPCIATCQNAGGCSYSTQVSATAPVTATAACWTDDGVYCSPDGICAATPALGQTCAYSAYCGKDAHCKNGNCAADFATGACQSNDECLAPSYCDYSADAASGQCAPLKPNGAKCRGSSECAGGQCYQFACRTWTMADPELCAGLLD
jgi:hypothetical protein